MHSAIFQGFGTLIWQFVFVSMLVVLFYGRQLLGWLRGSAGKSFDSRGYLFATAYALLATLLVSIVFTARPLPRFSDIFLIGIVLTAYLFEAAPAAYLLAISVAVSAWILPPGDSFAIANADDWYRVISFAAVSGFLIALIGRLKARHRAQRAIGAALTSGD